MSVYSTSLVERLLRNFLDIAYALEGNVQKLHDTSGIASSRKQSTQELPLGMKRNDIRGWPFREPRHARPPRDGKAQARAFEELHCSILDIEEAFPRISQEDQDLILKYHVLQTHTLDDLLLERKLNSRGAMQRRVRRAVERLQREMERGPYES